VNGELTVTEFFFSDLLLIDFNSYLLSQKTRVFLCPWWYNFVITVFDYPGLNSETICESFIYFKPSRKASTYEAYLLLYRNMKTGVSLNLNSQLFAIRIHIDAISQSKVRFD
jgi:hypothetical protein